MRKNKVLVEIILIMALVFALIIICENILKESSLFNIYQINTLLFFIISGASAYYFYSLSSNLPLYLSFGRTRKEIFKKSFINGGIVLLILFILNIFSVVCDILFRKSGLSLDKIFVSSKILYLVMGFIFFSFLGNLLGIISSNKYLNHSLLIGMLVVMMVLAFLLDGFVINIIGLSMVLINTILFFILKKKYYNNKFDI